MNAAFTLVPLLFFIIYLAIFFGILYLIYKWVNKFIALREEQNKLLREIVDKLDKNT